MRNNKLESYVEEMITNVLLKYSLGNTVSGE